MNRGFKLEGGVWRYAPEGGRINKEISHRAVPSDSPAIKELAQKHNLPQDVIRQAFGTLPPSDAPAPEQEVKTAKEVAAASGLKGEDAEKFAETLEKVAEAAATETEKPKKQKKAKKAAE